MSTIPMHESTTIPMHESIHMNTCTDGITDLSYQEMLEPSEIPTPVTPAIRDDRPSSAAAARSSLQNARGTSLGTRPAAAHISAALSPNEQPAAACASAAAASCTSGGERALKFQTLSTGTFAVMQTRAAVLPYRAWLLQVSERLGFV